jgi:Phospholipid methyltransferase
MTDVADRMRPLLGSLLFVVVVPGTVAVLIPGAITRWALAPWGPWPLVVAIAAGLITARAGVLLHAVGRFAVEGRGTSSPTAPTELLVVSGAYRYVRNPMYLAVASLIGGLALLCPSVAIVLYLALFARRRDGLRSLLQGAYVAGCPRRVVSALPAGGPTLAAKASTLARPDRTGMTTWRPKRIECVRSTCHRSPDRSRRRSAGTGGRVGLSRGSFCVTRCVSLPDVCKFGVSLRLGGARRVSAWPSR